VVGGPQAVAAPFTKWSNAAAGVSVLYGMIRRAGELAVQAPAGPVYVNTPVEVLLAPWKPAATGPVSARAVNGTVAVGQDVELAARLLAAAVPAARHEVVLLDMATAVMALGRIAQLKAAGKELPPGVALTADGEPTTDPALAKVPTPGRRGQGRGHVAGLRDARQRPRRQSDRAVVPLRRQGGQAAPAERLPARDRRRRLLPLDEFTAAIDDTVDAIKSLPPAAGTAEILVPGERGRRTAKDRAAAGIPLGPKAWRELTGIAAALGVPVPDPLS
jgi:hypothetical protein